MLAKSCFNLLFLLAYFVTFVRRKTEENKTKKIIIFIIKLVFLCFCFLRIISFVCKLHVWQYEYREMFNI